LRLLIGLLTVFEITYEGVWSVCRTTADRRKLKHWEENHPSATLSTANPTCTTGHRRWKAEEIRQGQWEILTTTPIPPFAALTVVLKIRKLTNFNPHEARSHSPYQSKITSRKTEGYSVCMLPFLSFPSFSFFPASRPRSVQPVIPEVQCSNVVW
jgi:hypothetical protein